MSNLKEALKEYDNKLNKLSSQIEIMTDEGTPAKFIADMCMDMTSLWNQEELRILRNKNDTMQAHIAELEKTLGAIRSIVTDVQDGFEVTGSDAEILDIINKTLEKY